jgi:hypothetical protein
MSDERAPHTAGAFDIRNVIGGLLGIYGIVLLATGALSDQAPAETGQLHADLWAGGALVVVSVVFLAWARLRPIVLARPPAEELPATQSPGQRPG